MSTVTLPELLIGLLALLCLAVIVSGLRLALARSTFTQRWQKKTIANTIAVLVLWVAAIAALSLSGVTSKMDTVPPRPLLIVFIPITIAAFLCFSKSFSAILKATPLHWLVLFQSFRIVVELLLWAAYEKGRIPVQMTFEGRNFDVVAGVLALATGYVMKQWPHRARPIGVVFNLAGLALLINIMAVSVLSLPTPMRYFTEGISSAAVTTFPFIYLPAMLVVFAFSFHLFSLRQLWLQWHTVRTPVASSGAAAVTA